MTKAKKKVKINKVKPSSTINQSDVSTSNNNHVKKPSINNVAFKPKKPTPTNLYTLSRIRDFLALGRSKAEAHNACVKEYKMMPREQKVQWILQALQQEPAYRV